MTAQETDALFIYSARYALGRHTYASSEVAKTITEYAHEMLPNNRHVLIRDIERALKEHKVDELSTLQWEVALKALKATEVRSGTPQRTNTATPSELANQATPTRDKGLETK